MSAFEVVRPRDARASVAVKFLCLCGAPIGEVLRGSELDGNVATETHCEDCGAAVEFTVCLDLLIEERDR